MTRLRIGFLGGGNIARTVRDELASRPYDVVGTFGRGDVIADDLDLLVEAATQRAVEERLVPIIARGTDVLLLSIGALADPLLRRRLTGGPGQLIACTGAIGGLDQVRALRLGGALREVTIESRKLPATLIQPWMDDALRQRLDSGQEEIMLDDDLATAVTRRFPASANVAAAVALAADAWDSATARVVADPTAARTRHTIHAAGELGEVTVTVTNEPSPERPRSSAVVARAVVRAIDDYARLRGFDAVAGVVVL
ncbi:aspartate dehydrogenase domain-containing protein [Microbacterium sp. GXS0129]|uniref:aspartate dehydrogenase domain-containing protein n=1 Tax=Microbacterium sp. GXS0129 TaxID=3377836 RepID=UPI00383BBCDF